MSLLSHFSQSLFSSLFGKKKETYNKESTTREIDTNSNSSLNSIPSFSVLNRSPTNIYNNVYHPNEYNSTIVTRENIFFGKDIDTNDTHEIIDYNLRKLRKSQKLENDDDDDDIMVSPIELSSEPIIESNITEKELNTKSFNIKNLKNEKDSESESENESESEDKTENESEIENENENKDKNEEDEDETENENDKSIDSNTKENNHYNELPNSKEQQKQQQKHNNNNNNKIKSKHNSISESILVEDLDLDKLIYNVPPPSFSRINNSNIKEGYPILRFSDSMSVPASMTKFRQTSVGRSYASKNILSHSLNNSQGSPYLSIPGIKTIELPKSSTTKSKHLKKRSALALSLSSSLSAPLSSSLLAIQQPSFASIISDDENNQDISNESDNSYDPFDDDEEEYDIFNYSMNKDL